MKTVASVAQLVSTGVVVVVLSVGCGASSTDQAEVPRTLPPLRTAPTDPPDEIAAVEDGSPSEDVPDVTVSDGPDPSELPTNPSIESQPTAERQAPSGELPRQTADGITVSRELERVDVGDGPEETYMVRASRGSTSTGISVDPELPVDTNTIDTMGWAGSGGVFVVMVEVGPTVAEVQLINVLGSLDTAAPSAERTAVLGIGADDLAQISMLALDADGNVIGSCLPDDLFLECTN